VRPLANDTAPPTGVSVLDATRALLPDIRACADAIERDRRLASPIVEALVRAGVFRMCITSSLGGGEVDPLTQIRVIEMLAAADGSTGWCAMIGATSGVISAYLPHGAGADVYASAPAVITGGVFAAKGTAVAVDGGYRVSGRWPFASGCEHCDWLMGGAVIEEKGATRRLSNGAPDARLMLFPAREARIIDTWTVSGLQGTGSHDIALSDVFVPHEHSVSLITDRPQYGGALYVFPVFGLLALGIAAVALGIARSAVDTLIELAADKTPTGSRRRLADRAAIQIEVAQAEAALRSARSFLNETVAATWELALAEGAIPIDRRALLRLAATHAAISAAQAVDRMYNAGGGTSVYATNLLQRHFRDIHVLTQHMMVAPATYELTGRLLLGVEADTTML
jgi:alkylation response protein AidB-like acyl-CoA dehydrogenase